MTKRLQVLGVRSSKRCESPREAFERAVPTGCVQKGNQITSVAAIVAPQTCTLVRDALVLVTPARPVTSRTIFSVTASPFGGASFGNSGPCIASVLQSLHRSSTGSASQRFPVQSAREQPGFRSTDAKWRGESRATSRLERSSIVPSQICDRLSLKVKRNPR